MFRRKPGDEQDKSMPETSDELGIPKPGPRPAPAATIGKPAPVLPPRPVTSSEPPRAGDLPRGLGRLDAAPAPAPKKAAETETRKLIVGREISLSGEITQCDRLVVEGSVEANLVGCRDIDIAESGLFKG